MAFVSSTVTRALSLSTTPPGGATIAALLVAWRDIDQVTDLSGTTIAWGSDGLFTQVRAIRSPLAPAAGAGGGGCGLAAYIAFASDFPTTGNTITPTWTPSAPAAVSTIIGVSYFDDAFSEVGDIQHSIQAPSTGLHEVNVATASGDLVLVFFNGGEQRTAGVFTTSDPVPTQRYQQQSTTADRCSGSFYDAVANDTSAFIENTNTTNNQQFMIVAAVGPASFPPELTGQLITVEGGIDYANSDRGLLDGIEYVPTSDTSKTQYGALEVGQRVRTLNTGIPNWEEFPGLDYVQPSEDFGYRAPDGTVYRSP